MRVRIMTEPPPRARFLSGREFRPATHRAALASGPPPQTGIRPIPEKIVSEIHPIRQ